MNSDKGVYALLLHLGKGRTLRIGKLGIFYFPVRWYVYLGSAHGPGGVRKRTDRHRKNNSWKKKRWNIDFLRSEARLCEIWFSQARQIFEHRWAHAFCDMEDAMMHAEKFGAQDCYPLCPTHLLQYDIRPSLPAFRYRVANRYPDQPPIFSQFVGAFSTDPSTRSIAGSSLEASYHSGRQVTERWYRASYDGLFNGDLPDSRNSKIFCYPEYPIRFGWNFYACLVQMNLQQAAG